jgi:hypothetical protein
VLALSAHYKPPEGVTLELAVTVPQKCSARHRRGRTLAGAQGHPRSAQLVAPSRYRWLIASDNGLSIANAQSAQSFAAALDPGLVPLLGTPHDLIRPLGTKPPYLGRRWNPTQLIKRRGLIGRLWWLQRRSRHVRWDLHRVVVTLQKHPRGGRYLTAKPLDVDTGQMHEGFEGASWPA